MFLQQGRVQFQDQQAHFLQGLQGIILDLTKVAVHLLDVSLRMERDGGCAIETDAVKQLGHRIVQFAGNAVPFLKGGKVLSLFVQACILNGDCHLVGDRLGKMGVRIGIVARLVVGQAEQSRNPIANNERDADP